MSLKNIFLAKPSDIKFRYFLVGFPAMIHIVTDSSGLHGWSEEEPKTIATSPQSVLCHSSPLESGVEGAKDGEKSIPICHCVEAEKVNRLKMTNPIFGLMTNFIFSQFSGDAHKRG